MGISVPLLILRLALDVHIIVCRLPHSFGVQGFLGQVSFTGVVAIRFYCSVWAFVALFHLVTPFQCLTASKAILAFIFVLPYRLFTDWTKCNSETTFYYFLRYLFFQCFDCLIYRFTKQLTTLPRIVSRFFVFQCSYCIFWFHSFVHLSTSLANPAAAQQAMMTTPIKPPSKKHIVPISMCVMFILLSPRLSQDLIYAPYWQERRLRLLGKRDSSSEGLFVLEKR